MTLMNGDVRRLLEERTPQRSLGKSARRVGIGDGAGSEMGRVHDYVGTRKKREGV